MDNKTVTIIAVAAFVIGILLGSGISGKKDSPKADARELLTQAIKKIDSIEKEKNSLKADLERATRSSLSKENKELQEKLSHLSGQLAHAEMRLEETADLRPEIARKDEQIAALEKANQDLKSVLEKISSLTVPPQSGIPEQPTVETKTEQIETEEHKAKGQ